MKSETFHNPHVMNRRTKAIIGLITIAAIVLLVAVMRSGNNAPIPKESQAATNSRDTRNDIDVKDAREKPLSEQKMPAGTDPAAPYHFKPVAQNSPPALVSQEPIPWITRGKLRDTQILERDSGRVVWRTDADQSIGGVAFNEKCTKVLIAFAVAQEGDETAAVYRTSDFSKTVTLPANCDYPRGMGCTWQRVKDDLLLGRCLIQRHSSELDKLTAAEMESDAGVEKTKLVIYNTEKGTMWPIVVPEKLASTNVVRLGIVRPDGYVQIWDAEQGRYAWLHLE